MRSFAGVFIAVVVATAIVVAAFILISRRPRAEVANHWLGWIVGCASLLVLERFLYSAPVFAPLLFVNLAIVARIGAGALRSSSSRA